MFVTLIQPRAPWGFHAYLPNGLLSVASRLSRQGVRSVIFDENVGDRLDDAIVRNNLAQADIIGIGVLGSPFIPEAIRVGQAIRRMGYSQPIFIGGEVIMRLTVAQFEGIFSRIGGRVIRVESDEGLGRELGLSLPTMYATSMTPAIRDLSERARQIYFRKEWCLFTSQGCIYKCNFCAATKGVPERFRDPEAFRDEVSCLAQMVKRYAGSYAPYEVYCSTLDGCQNPEEMEATLAMVAEESRRVGVYFPLRFLATSKMTVRTVSKDPLILRRWHSYGLGCIGLGVDGPGRGETRKHKASLIEENGAFVAIREAGIQSEATMVIGLPSDGYDAIRRGIERMLELVSMGVRPRLLLGKEAIPGNEGWATDQRFVTSVLQNPDLFRELDYGGLASPATHNDRRQRATANIAFFATTMALKVMSPYGCPTQPLFPTVSVARPWRIVGRAWNRLMPQDR